MCVVSAFSGGAGIWGVPANWLAPPAAQPDSVPTNILERINDFLQHTPTLVGKVPIFRASKPFKGAAGT